MTRLEQGFALSAFGRLQRRQHQDRWRHEVDGIDPEVQLRLLWNHLQDQARPDPVLLRRIKRASKPEPLSPHQQAEEARYQALGGESVYDMLASIRTARRAEVTDHLRERMHPHGAHLLLLGPADPDEVIARAERLFSRWQGDTTPLAQRPHAAPAPSERQLLWFDTGSPQAQSSLALSCRLDPATPQAAALATSIVQQQLDHVLRQQSGLTYGVRVRPHRALGGTLLDLDTEIQAGSEALAIEQALGTLARLAGEGPSPAELAQGRIIVARDTAARLQSPAGVLEELVERTVQGWAGTGLAEQLVDTDTEAIQRTLAPCVGREVLTVVGDPQLGQRLEEGGLQARPGR